MISSPQTTQPAYHDDTVEPKAAPRGHWRRGRESIMVGAVLTLVAAVDLAMSHFGFDLLEEGFFAAFARRVQLGDLPYRDFTIPYTPAVLYLYARALDWFGLDITALRWFEIVAQIGLLLGLYVAARQLVPPLFAAGPPVVFASMQTLPELWSLHPGWYSAAAALFGVVLVARYLRNGRATYLAAAGAASAVSFAFKQNLGVFSLIAALWLLVASESHLPTTGLPWRAGPVRTLPRRVLSALRRLRTAIKAAALVLLPATGVVLIRQSWTASGVAVLIVPLVALPIASATRIVFRDAPRATYPPATVREVSFYARPLLVLLGFGAVTVPWLALLVVALHGRIELLSAFVGGIDTTGYAFALPRALPSEYLLFGLALLVAAGVAIAATRGGERWRPRALWFALIAGVGLPILTFYAAGGTATAGPLWAAAAPAWSWYAETGTPGESSGLFELLPTLAFWAGLASLLRRDLRRARRLNTRTLLRFWYLVAGSVLLLHQYPRMDGEHLLWSGGPLLVVGAEVLYTAYGVVLRRVPVAQLDVSVRAAASLALVLIPTVVVVPEARDRLAGAGEFFARTLSAPTAPDHAVQLTAPGAGAPVWVPARQGEPLQQLVRSVDAETAPGEPIFAYPAIPGIYYLADRPNPTRFNHLLTGMANAADQQTIVRELAPVRLIVWDGGGVNQWVQPPGNPIIEQYVKDNFHVEAVIGLYALMQRNGA